MKVFVRADGGTEMGYGHLYRSNAVAKALLDSGCSVTYLTETPDTVSLVCSQRVEVFALETSTQEKLLSVLPDLNPDAVYIDLPEAPHSIQRSIRKICPLGVFLGTARHKLCCDLLVNGHLYAEREDYQWESKEPVWCIGPDYLPLREPFPELAAREQKYSRSPQSALVLMGGSDPHNLTPKVMVAFEDSNLSVTVVVGPGNENKSEINRTTSSVSCDFTIVRAPDDLPERMFAADIAVSGFGTTAYELMATRTPFIGIARTPLEQETARKVSDYVDIPTFESNASVSEIKAVRKSLQESHRRRTNFSNRFEALIDGNGAERIARELQSLVRE
jgi:spore coat polysaccharide biosynthesis predicted glycosyltransferase SpsG